MLDRARYRKDDAYYTTKAVHYKKIVMTSLLQRPLYSQLASSSSSFSS